jgi:hypothetical protein
MTVEKEYDIILDLLVGNLPRWQVSPDGHIYE